MLNEGYILSYAQTEDIDSWMRMVEIVKDNFPGIERSRGLDDYRETVIKNIKRGTALCVKCGFEVVGVLIFSFNSKCISCMAVHPEHRKMGIGSAMVEKVLSLFPDDADITVTTFREGDTKGIVPRALYKKYGFEEDELVTEFGYPNQKFVLHRKRA